MMILIWLIVSVSTLWVYYDATEQCIGFFDKTKNRDLFELNQDADDWALTVLLTWIVAFPIYVINRSKLIALAEKTPITTTPGKRVASFITLSLLTILGFIVFIGLAFFSPQANNLSPALSAIPFVYSLSLQIVGFLIFCVLTSIIWASLWVYYDVRDIGVYIAGVGPNGWLAACLVTALLGIIPFCLVFLIYLFSLRGKAMRESLTDSTRFQWPVGH